MRQGQPLARGRVRGPRPAGGPVSPVFRLRRLLYPVYLLAVLPQTHRFNRRAVLDIVELMDDPLLLLGQGFASPEWFYAACQVAHIAPRVLLESASPQTVIALAAAGEGIAVIPSNVMVLRGKVRVVPLIYRRTPIGRWQIVARDPRRFLPPYAEQFVEEIAAYLRRDHPGRNFIKRAPPLPRPRQQIVALPARIGRSRVRAWKAPRDALNGGSPSVAERKTAEAIRRLRTFRERPKALRLQGFWGIVQR